MSEEQKWTRVPDIMVMNYAHDRRKHRHRCQGCNKIVNAGEPVFMARVANKITRVVHQEPCAGMLTFDEMTHLQRMATHAYAFLNKHHTGEQAVAWARAALAHTNATDTPPRTAL